MYDINVEDKMIMLMQLINFFFMLSAVVVGNWEFTYIKLTQKSNQK